MALLMTESTCSGRTVLVSLRWDVAGVLQQHCPVNVAGNLQAYGGLAALHKAGIEGRRII